MGEIAPTYAFEDDKVFAIVAGRVVADGKSVEEIEDKTNEHVEALKAEKEKKEYEANKRNATHIITPNGLEGQLLGRVSTWHGGDQVTAKFANGQTATFTVSDGDKVEYVQKREKKVASSESVKELQERLDADYEHDKEALASRLVDLKEIGRVAHELLVKGASVKDEAELDKIRAVAAHEANEVGSALEYLEQADDEAIGPPEPFHAGVVEQASMGHGASSDWLEVTAQEMVKEAEETDYEKYINEGPALLVTELETGTLADAGSTRSVAQDAVQAKTAGLEGEDIDEYRTLFVSRVEVARRTELADRKNKVAKTATTKEAEVSNSPDEALFL